MSEKVFIRAEIIGGLPSGQKRIHLLCNGADGNHFYTDDKSLLKASEVRKVVHGWWVSDEADVLFHCSECGTQISTSWDYDDLHWNYCPECGAEMGNAQTTPDDDWDYDDDWDEYPEEDYLRDRCYECRGYGDDYYIDEQGELVCACDDCSFNGRNDDDD